MQTLPVLTERVHTSQRNEMIDVTDRVARLIRTYRLIEAMIVVYVPHTTAAVTINENADPDVKSDLLAKLSALAPKEETFYRHAEGNSDSHVKASMLGQSVTVLVERGRLVLGRWQGIYFCEFDGPREREMVVKVVKFGPNDTD
jgi:secondary thiamine-phosphate synthase enzyme